MPAFLTDQNPRPSVPPCSCVKIGCRHPKRHGMHIYSHEWHVSDCQRHPEAAHLARGGYPLPTRAEALSRLDELCDPEYCL